MVGEFSPTIDIFANLAARTDNKHGMTESFTYDYLNRLETITLNNGIGCGMEYDDLGRITSKQDVFSDAIYNDSDKPHAIREATLTGNPFAKPLQNIQYTMFDKVARLRVQEKQMLYYQYGFDHQRTKMREMDLNFPVITCEKTYVGNCEYWGSSMFGPAKSLTYLAGPMGVFAVAENSGDEFEIHYIHKDHLGSWTTITDENSEIEQEASFDAWGNIRSASDWTSPLGDKLMFDRGFTGHEHLFFYEREFHFNPSTDLTLINMNGRVYDPVMSSFLSVDNYVQSPENSQNFNRYAYCLNNPLKYTDPDGEWVQYVVGGLLGAFNGYSIGKAAGLTGWRMAGSIIGGAAVGAITGGIGTSVTSSVGMGTGSLCAGAVCGSGFSIIQGMANHEDAGSILTSSIMGGLYGGVSGWIGGSVGAVVGGGAGAFFGGAASNITSQLLTHDYSSGEKLSLNWKSALLSSCMSLGIYLGSSYMNFCKGAKDFCSDGQTFSFRQYREMQSSYTRGRFFKGEKYGGGFWLTSKGTSTQGISYSENELEHNVVRFDFSQKPDDAFSTYHPHPYDESGYYQGRKIADGNLWHSDVDIANVKNNGTPSMIVNKYGAEFVTVDCKYRDYNWWGYGKPYYSYPWFCASYYFKLKQ